jgi:hypothetical protein
MRISEDRYSRDLRRIHLAQRMIRHEVRTQWICAWSGLSAGRVRNLFRSYEESLGGARRHRGPSPRRIASYLRSPALRAEASAAGGLACVLGVVPDKPVPRKALQSLETGERLCHAYELYREIVPESRLTMDQLIILVIALAEGEDLVIGHCVNCHGALLLDRLGASRRLCFACRQAAGDPSLDAAAQLAGGADKRSEESEGDVPKMYQQALF